MYNDLGEAVGITYEGVTYYYIKNLQGDVIGLLNGSGSVVARYAYDAWGKLISVKDASSQEITDESHVAMQNPIRYRGYVYDSEIELYYLQSRYYDAGIGRFINADAPEMLSLSAFNHIGANLFAYSYNNPTLNSDESGYGVLPVGLPGYFYKNYKTSVSKWAEKYAPMSKDVEYGAIIYRFRVLFLIWYFIGETYKGFETYKWYTVIKRIKCGIFYKRRCKVGG